MKYLRKLLTAVALGFIAITNVHAARAEQLRTLKYVTAPAMEADLPVIVADRKGYFADEGLKVDFAILGGALSRTALASGGADFGNLHVAALWSAVRAGLPLKFISAYYTKEAFSIIASDRVKDKVKTVADLKGRTILTARAGGASYAAAVFMLKSGGGLDIDKDVHPVTVSSTDPRIWLNFIKTGKVDAIAGSWEPITSIILSQGNSYLLLDLRNAKQANKLIGGDVVSNGLVMNGELVKRDPELVRKIQHATDRALKYIHEASVKELTQICKKSVFGYLDNTILTHMVASMKPNFKLDGRPSVSSYERSMNVYLRGGFLKKPIPFSAIAWPIAGRDP